MKQTFLVPALLLLHLSVLAINPSREYTMTPASFQLTYTEHRLATSDSAELAVWVLEPDTDVKSPYTFIIAGSDAGNMGYSLPYAFYLLQQGIRVITFDYRGFGASSDFAHRADYLLHEEYITDMETVLEWVNAQDFSGKTGVLAFSMGTWIARAAYPVQPFDAFVAEGLILRPELVIEQIHAAKNEQLLLPDNYAADRIATLSWPIPTLVFASRADTVTTLEHSNTFAESADQCSVIAFDGEHLRGAMSLGMPAYMAAIVDLLKE